MELRLMSSEAERKEFARTLAEARACRGAGFSETKRSVVGQVHLAFGRLYALFDEESPDPDQMLAGFAIHDLATFPQSYPRPDLTHLPPESVYECGELWATAAGGAQLARHAGFILAEIEKAKALLVYPIFKPWNLSYVYKGFSRVGEPIEWPYARTLEGGKIFVQPMVLEGAALQSTLEAARSYGYRTIGDEACIRFNSPSPIYTKKPSKGFDRRLWHETPAVPAQERAAA
jgi:hypothetical protein